MNKKWKSFFNNSNHLTQKKTSWTFYLICTEDLDRKNSIATTYHCQRLLKSTFQKVKMKKKFSSLKNYSMNQKISCQSFQKNQT